MQALNPIILKGEEITSIYSESNELHLKTRSGKHYRFYHDQDCCEKVSIHDINGDISLFCGGYVVEDVIERIIDNENPDDVTTPGWKDCTFTWTTHTFVLRPMGDSKKKVEKVSIRWYGTSNGCYSEAVTLEQVNKISALSVKEFDVNEFTPNSLIVVKIARQFFSDNSDILIPLKQAFANIPVDKRITVLVTQEEVDINLISEEQMSQAGWYRKENN